MTRYMMKVYFQVGDKNDEIEIGLKEQYFKDFVNGNKRDALELANDIIRINIFDEKSQYTFGEEFCITKLVFYTTEMHIVAVIDNDN